MSTGHRVLRRLLTVLLAAAAATVVAAVPASAAGTTVITGRVTGVDGRSLQNVTVTALYDGKTLAQTSTTRDGRYRLAVPEYFQHGRYGQVQFLAATAVGGTSPTGYADRCYQGPPLCGGGKGFSYDGTPRVLDVVLARANVLRGRVTDSVGRGVGGLPVYARARDNQYPPSRADAATTTDVNGNYALTRLDPEVYDVIYAGSDPRTTPATPNPNGYAYTSVTRTLTGGRTYDGDLTIEAGGGIKGVVVDASGNPVAGVSVFWETTRPPGPPEANDTSAADGSFAIRFVLPDTAPLCVVTAQVNTCSSDTSGAPQVTVRQYRTTTVRVVLPAST